MSANHSDPTPVTGAQESQKQISPQAQPGWNGQMDPYQPLREYVSPDPRNASAAQQPQPWTAPGWSNQPAMPAPSAYPGNPPQFAAPYPGQSAGLAYPGQMVYPGPTGQAPYPAPGPYPGMSGYPLPPYAYGYYGWAPMAIKPRRDTYTFVVGIIAFAGSCIAVLCGLASLAFLALSNLISNPNLDSADLFSGDMLFLVLGIAGVVGGGICIYHSSRSLFLRKPSAAARIPQFWIFLLLYLGTLLVAFLLHAQGMDVETPPLTGLLICLAAAFPALTFFSLGIRRLRRPGSGLWPTTWRRLTFALVSGATLAILLASILETVLGALLLGSQYSILQSLLNSNYTPSQGQSVLLLIMLAVIAPLVEELVKPLAVIVLIGRVRSKAEAFALGLACGIGFNLIETTGYMSQSYNGWLGTALARSGSGLLHGFGAAVMALGWYCLTHKEEGSWTRRILLAVGCGIYAILQHAFWNGFWGLALLPGQFGNLVSTWTWNLGPLTLDIPTIFNILEMIGILVFFIYLSGRLRAPTNPPQSVVQSDSGVSPNSLSPTFRA